MKRPKITDQKIKDYVEDLERKLESYESEDTEVLAYLALKHFIETNSTTLKDVKMSSDLISDKDDKMVDRARVFFKDLPGHISALKTMKKDLNDDKIKKVEKKFIRKSGVSIEEMM